MKVWTEAIPGGEENELDYRTWGLTRGAGLAGSPRDTGRTGPHPVLRPTPPQLLCKTIQNCQYWPIKCQLHMAQPYHKK